MKKYTFILLTLSLMVFTSCLRHGLEELPVFEDKDIASVQRVEYRFIGDRVSGASGQLQDGEGVLQGEVQRGKPGGKAGHFQERPRAYHRPRHMGACAGAA